VAQNHRLAAEKIVALAREYPGRGLRRSGLNYGLQSIPAAAWR